MKKEKMMREGTRRLYVVDWTGPCFRQEKGEEERG
jgi:seryl-tRNA synthetase